MNAFGRFLPVATGRKRPKAKGGGQKRPVYPINTLATSIVYVRGMPAESRCEGLEVMRTVWASEWPRVFNRI